jgi:F-type H+-transporting ATPase subunit b
MDSWAFDLQIWSQVVFGILVVVLFVFVGTPLSDAMRRRRHNIVEGLRQADLAEEELRKAREAHERERQRFRELARDVIAEANRDAERTKSEILARAESEGKRTRDRSDREIRMATQRTLHEIWSTAANLSSTVAEKIIANELNAEDHDRLVREAIGDIGSAVGGKA